MNDRPPQEIIAHDLGELQAHIETGNQRIKAYYLDRFDPPDRFEDRPLDRPPHQDIIERGARLIELASRIARGRDGKKITTFGDPEREAEFVLYSVGLECLLTGIHLQIDPESFISYMISNNGRTPGLSDCKRVVIRDISDELYNEDLSVLSLLIDFVIEHRNNEVHFGFHRMGHHYLERLVLEVSVSLIERYSEQPLDEANHIQELIDEMWSRAPPGAESREVQFDPW